MLDLSLKESDILLGVLLPGEKTMAKARQRRFHKATLFPTVAIATDRRVIILNRRFLGLKSSITVVTYDNIASFKITHGIMLSSIKLRLKSSKNRPAALNTGIEEGEIVGLSRKGALDLTGVITAMLNNYEILDKSELKRAKRGNMEYIRISRYIPFESAQNTYGYVELENSIQLEKQKIAKKDISLKPEDLMIFKYRAGKK